MPVDVTGIIREGKPVAAAPRPGPVVKVLVTAIRDGRDQHGRFVTDGEFVVPGGDGPVALEAVDPALDRMPPLVVVLLELRGPPAARAALLPVADAVRRDGDRGFDPASTQVGAVVAGVVRLVGPHPVRPLAWPAGPEPGHADRFQDGLEPRRVAPLPSRDHNGQGLLALLNGEVDFAGQAAPGASKAVVGRLDEDAAGRLLLEVPLFAAPAAC